MIDNTPRSGWQLVAEEDGTAEVIAGLLDVDPDTEYTRSELAEAAGVPLKTLYLLEALDDLETAGMLERTDDPDVESEARFAINEHSEVYQAAQRFDDALAEQL